MGGLILLGLIAQLALLVVPFYGMVVAHTEDERAQHAGMFLAAVVSTGILILMICGAWDSVDVPALFADN